MDTRDTNFYGTEVKVRLVMVGIKTGGREFGRKINFVVDEDT